MLTWVAGAREYHHDEIAGPIVYTSENDAFRMPPKDNNGPFQAEETAMGDCHAAPQAGRRELFTLAKDLQSLSTVNVFT